MQPKGVSLKMKLLLLSCIVSMVLAVANADSSDSDRSNSDSSDSDSSDSDSSSGDSSEENPRRPFPPIFRPFLRRGRAASYDA